LIGLRRSRLEGCIAVILASWSYLLIHFGTEACGYSMVDFSALLAWYALQQFEERRSRAWTVVFWSAVMLGFLAHLEFAVCFAGLVVWSLWRFTSHRQKWRQAVLDLFALFTVPVMLVWSSIGPRTHVSALAIADQDGFLHARRAWEQRPGRNHSSIRRGRVMRRSDLFDG
jgi:hypothetical protein